MSHSIFILAADNSDSLRVGGEALGHVAGWTQATAGELAQSLHNAMPPHVVQPAIVGAALFLSLLIWFRGASLARPSLTLLGLVIGGLLGAAVTMPIAGTVIGLPVPVAGGVLGSVIGGFVGWASFRIVVGGVAGVLAGTLAFVVSLAQTSIASGTDERTPVRERFALSNDEATIAQDAEELWQRTLRGEVVASKGEEAEAQQASVGIDPIAVARTAVTARFEALPDKQKLFVSAAAAIVAAVGTLLGIVAPRFTTSLAAAAVGTTGVVVFGLAAGHMLRWNGMDRFAQDPSNLAVVWGVLAMMSVVAQRPRKRCAIAAPTPVPVQPAPAC